MTWAKQFDAGLICLRTRGTAIVTILVRTMTCSILSEQHILWFFRINPSNSCFFMSFGHFLTQNMVILWKCGKKKTWKSNCAQMRRKLQWSPHLLFGPSTLFRSNQILQCALIAFSIWSKQGWAILPTWLLVTQSKTFNTWATCMMGPMVVDFQHWIT